MIRATLALPVMIAAFWDAWRLLGSRFGDNLSAVPLALILVAVAWPALRRRPDGASPHVPAALPCAMMALYVAAAVAGPALAQIVVAVVAILVTAHKASAGRLPPAPLVVLGLLALPVLPSFDFYLAYPMRMLCAALTAGLLRLNGLAVGVDGVALSWHGSLILFDAACSGVRMLWAALFLVSAIALAAGFGVRRYAGGLAVAVALTIVGNALRAASLFYVENGFVDRLSGPVAHEAVGIVSFLLLGLLTAVAVSPRHWRLV
jgi:exosortase/archaeosortase family protein